jgi:hypothetical protein
MKRKALLKEDLRAGYMSETAVRRSSPTPWTRGCDGRHFPASPKRRGPTSFVFAGETLCSRPANAFSLAGSSARRGFLAPGSVVDR